MNLGRNIIYACLLSQSLFFQILNTVSGSVFKKIIFHFDLKRYHEKVVLLQVKGGLKKFCACLYHAPNILVWGKKYSAQKQFCSNTQQGIQKICTRISNSFSLGQLLLTN